MIKQRYLYFIIIIIFFWQLPLLAKVKSKEEDKFNKRTFIKYKKDFKKMCSAIALDGRLEELYPILEFEASKEYFPNCLGCGYFFKKIRGACKPKLSFKKKNKKLPNKDNSKKEEQQIVKQRLPNITVLFYASKIGFNLSEENGANIIYDTLEYLEKKTAQNKYLSPASREYMSNLVYYLKHPLEEHLEQFNQDKKQHLKEEEQEKRVEEIFIDEW